MTEAERLHVENRLLKTQNKRQEMKLQKDLPRWKGDCFKLVME